MFSKLKAWWKRHICTDDQVQAKYWEQFPDRVPKVVHYLKDGSNRELTYSEVMDLYDTQSGAFILEPDMGMPQTKGQIMRAYGAKHGIPVVDIKGSTYEAGTMIGLPIIGSNDREHELTMVQADMEAKSDRDGCGAPKAQDDKRSPTFSEGSLGDILHRAINMQNEAEVLIQPIRRHSLENGYGADFYHTIANRMVGLHNEMSKESKLSLSLSPRRK